MYKFKKSTGGSFTFPRCLKDISMRKYIDYLTLVEPTKPKELARVEDAAFDINYADDKEKDSLQTAFNEALEALTGVVMYRKIYPFYARVVAFFAEGLTESEIKGGKKQGDGMNVGHLEYLYNSLIKMINNPEEPEYSPVIMVDKELWYLPMRYMEKSKLIEYAEASQFEANMQELLNGNWLALPKIMCVLVRKEGEVYSDKLLSREEMFLDWSLEDCYRVAFFLLKRNETSLLSLKAYTAAQDLTKLKLGLNN